MDTEILVESHLVDGEKLIAQLVRDSFDVLVAFWAKSADESYWYLYLASHKVDPEKMGASSSAMFPSFWKIPEPSFTLLEIRLLQSQDPLAKAAAAFRDRNARGRLPIRCLGKQLGYPKIEEVYIYPNPLGPLTQAEVLQTIAALMSRSGIAPPARVTFRDGSTIHALPINVQVRQPGRVEIGFLDVGTNASRIVEANDVVEIR